MCAGRSHVTGENESQGKHQETNNDQQRHGGDDQKPALENGAVHGKLLGLIVSRRSKLVPPNVTVTATVT